MTAADARALWGVAEREVWAQALGAYETVLAAQGVKGLVDLDRWYRLDLPAAIAARESPFVTLDELVRVVEWKMRRGEWRPRNLALVRGNDAERARTASERAFSLAPDPRRPVACLADLAGVGPATASAVLATHRGDLYPFLDDLVGAAVPDLARPQFTLPYYVRYAEALRRRAEDLGGPWTAQLVGLALWAATGGKAGR